MAEHTNAVQSLALAIDQLRKLDRRLVKNGFLAYSDPLRGALAELENVRQLLAALAEEAAR